jgi:GNAT superfamily N-acetyltransferase
LSENAAPAKRYDLREATASDIPTLVRHRRLLMEEIDSVDQAILDDHLRVYRGWLRSRLRSGSVVGWIASVGDVQVASGLVFVLRHRPHPSNPSGRTPYLMAMYTDPAHRRQGIASAIVRAATDWATKADFSYITLHATDMGIAVYEALGFARGEREMWRSLKP